MNVSKSNPQIYAGIGSRRTPQPILNLMAQLGHAFASLDWTLRSGNCLGADQAFQQSANAVDPKLVELYLPWKGYEAKAIKPDNAVYTANSQAFSTAGEFHPAWNRCGNVARKMHARNAQIIMGHSLAQPAGLVICWTPGGKETGGTGQGIRIAGVYGVPVFNLALESGRDFACGILGDRLCKADKSGQLCFGF